LILGHGYFWIFEPTVLLVCALWEWITLTVYLFLTDDQDWSSFWRKESISISTIRHGYKRYMYQLFGMMLGIVMCLCIDWKSIGNLPSPTLIAFTILASLIGAIMMYSLLSHSHRQ
jgi:hypothetical protein